MVFAEIGRIFHCMGSGRIGAALTLVAALVGPVSAFHEGGVAAWCGNCHGRYHNAGNPSFSHPEDRALGGQVQGIYNSYLGSGDYTGDGNDAYNALVPYEDRFSPGTNDPGPARGGSRVMCLSCHRAHASSAPYAGRWDFNIGTWADEGVASGSYPIPNPYPAVGAAQGSLCEKCHGTQIPD